MKLSNNRGYALVVAIAITALLTITAVGFVNVVMNEVENETQALENDQSFFAAESALLLGVQWLRTCATFPNPGMSFTPFTGLQVNGCFVDVTITTHVNGSIPYAKVHAEAFNHPTDRTATEFLKRISYNNVEHMTFGAYGTFFDDTYNGHSNWGGFYRRRFDGRFHMNTWIEISGNSAPGSGNEVVFENGLVTVASDYFGQYGDGSHDNNNYDYGLQLNFDPDPGDCDQIFTDKYIANAEKISLPEGLASGDFQAQPHIDLPTSSDGGVDDNDYRPTLEFKIEDGIPKAIYHYYDGGFKKEVYTNYNNQILICPENLNVLGTVRGKVTVATTEGKSIVPVDDVVYEDYNTTTKEIPSGSQNILGLVSGKHIIFNHRWKKNWDGNSSYQYTSGTLDLTASVIAVEEIDGKKSVEYWDLYNECNYSLALNGNHILKAWRYPTRTSNGNPIGGCMGSIDYMHDRRLIKDIQPPGFPFVHTDTNPPLLKVTLGGWVEENMF